MQDNRTLHLLAYTSIAMLFIGAVQFLSTFRKSQYYRPNFVRGLAERPSDGKIINIRGNRKFGRKTPAKRYWIKGARRKSDYAWPTGYKYPLIFRDEYGNINEELTKKHIIRAKSYFTRYKKLYPKAVRKEIAERINKTNTRFKAGPTIVTG